MPALVPHSISVLAAALALAACTPTASLWSEADAHREIGVQRVQLTYDVAFAPGSAEFAREAARKLDGFLARQQVGYGDIVEIRVPGQDMRLDARRASVVTDGLARSGIVAERRVGEAPTGLRLAVIRSVAIPPACPDWRKADNDGDPSNTPMPNLGCANMRNLGLMIADPSELMAGRSMSPGSGEPLAAGVARYRAGQVTPLVPLTESSAGTTK
jgi:pilus assembly protein CpaD